MLDIQIVISNGFTFRFMDARIPKIQSEINEDKEIHVEYLRSKSRDKSPIFRYMYDI